MPSNRRRNAVVLPIATWAMWIVLAAFISCAGLFYVYCKNQLHAGGEQIKVLERELAELHNSNEVAQTSIAMLSSPKALQVRRAQEKNFLASYVDINRENLVVVSDRMTPTLAGDFRAVANTTP
jgi:hypothetical protein